MALCLRRHPDLSASNPHTDELIADAYPVATSADIDAMLDAGLEAATTLRSVGTETISAFLEADAEAIDAAKEELAALASNDTGLAVTPRLAVVEIPRTTGQLRQAAAARCGDWQQPVIDTANNLRSQLEPLGKPILVIGPNNCPFAFNGISGGDFAAAIATRPPRDREGPPGHQQTSRRAGAWCRCLHRSPRCDGAAFLPFLPQGRPSHGG